MSSATAADQLIKELSARSNFVEKQRAAAMPVDLLRSAQVTKLITIIAKSKLDAVDGARVTEAVFAGLWSDEQKHNMNLAVANAVAHCDGGAEVMPRKQQHASYPERMITVGDRAAFSANQGDETVSCMITGTRMFTVGIDCPSEKLKQRLGSIAMVLGGLNLDVSATEKKRLASKVRTCIKRLDSKARHGLPQLVEFPDDPNDLDNDRFQHVGFVDDPPADIEPDVVQKIESVLHESAARSTSLKVTPRTQRQIPTPMRVVQLSTRTRGRRRRPPSC